MVALDQACKHNKNTLTVETCFNAILLITVMCVYVLQSYTMSYLYLRLSGHSLFFIVPIHKQGINNVDILYCQKHGVPFTTKHFNYKMKRSSLTENNKGYLIKE